MQAWAGDRRHPVASTRGRAAAAGPCTRPPLRNPAACDQRMSWFIDTIGSMIASTSTSTMAPIATIVSG